MKAILVIISCVMLLEACGEKTSGSDTDQANDKSTTSLYSGTASVSQGAVDNGVKTIHKCTDGRTSVEGVVTSTDGKQWTMPASTHFSDASFPVAPDLHNACTGNEYATAEEALAKLDDSDIIEIDADGDLYTTYIFPDNYFEMYISKY